MSINYSAIAGRVSARRKHLNLTQAELAEKAGLSTRYIAKIESPKNRSLSIDSASKIRRALEVSSGYLFDGVDDIEIEGYTEVAEKLKLCNPQQLRQASRHIDVILTE